MQIFVLSDESKSELVRENVMVGEKDATGGGNPEWGLGVYNPDTHKSIEWDVSKWGASQSLAYRSGPNDAIQNGQCPIYLGQIFGATAQRARYPKGTVVTNDAHKYEFTDPDYGYQLYLTAYDKGTAKPLDYDSKDWTASVPHVVDIVDFENIPGNSYEVKIKFRNEWADVLTGCVGDTVMFAVKSDPCAKCKPGEKGDPNVVAAKLWNLMRQSEHPYLGAVELIVVKDGTGTKQPGDKLASYAEAETFIKAVENPPNLSDPRGVLKIRVIGTDHEVPRHQDAANAFKHVMDRSTMLTVSLADGFEDCQTKVVEVIRPLCELGAGVDVMQMEVGAGRYHGNPRLMRFQRMGRTSVVTRADGQKYYDIYTIDHGNKAGNWAGTQQHRQRTVIAIAAGKRTGGAGPKYDADTLDKLMQGLVAL